MKNHNSADKTAHLAVYKVLRPLVRLLLRSGVSFGTFVDIARHVFVDVATADFEIPDKKQSVSRVAILTGMNRRDVGKLQKRKLTLEDDMPEYNPAALTISGWINDSDFHNQSNQPAPLPMEGEISFTELVRRYGKNVPAKAIEDELLRINAVKEVEDGRIELLENSYIPHDNLEEKLQIVGESVADLVNTLDHNLHQTDEDARVQRSVVYTNIPAECLPKIRNRSKQEAQDFLVQVNGWLSECDRDVNTSLVGSGKKRAGIGIYFFEEDSEENQTP